jgi:pimeloyl-ACP methyl ester carboxylesterase
MHRRSGGFVQIILIPGLMNDGWVWRHQIGALSRIAPVTIANNDGCGSLGGMAERVLAASQGPLAVIGHSMGGRVALEVAARAPERVVRLGLLDTGAGGAAEAEGAGRMRLVELAREDGMAAVAREWLPPMLAPANRANGGMIAGITEMLERCTPDNFALQQHALMARPDRTVLLPAIGCPTLVATGSEDAWAPPAQHRAMADALPAATLKIIEGAGHMAPVEAPEALTSILSDWLRGSAA